MTNKQVYSLCEAVADIAYIAAKKNYELKIIAENLLSL